MIDGKMERGKSGASLRDKKTRERRGVGECGYKRKVVIVASMLEEVDA
jgi:hypothetical protein